MTEEQVKVITEYLDEHLCDNDNINLGFSDAYCHKCNKIHGNRTFTTHYDYW